MRRSVVAVVVVAVVLVVGACRGPREPKPTVDPCKPWEPAARRRFEASIANEPTPHIDGGPELDALVRATADRDRYVFFYDELEDCCLFETDFRGADLPDGGHTNWGCFRPWMECVDKRSGAVVRKARW